MIITEGIGVQTILKSFNVGRIVPMSKRVILVVVGGVFTLFSALLADGVSLWVLLIASLRGSLLSWYAVSSLVALLCLYLSFLLVLLSSLIFSLSLTWLAYYLLSLLLALSLSLFSLLLCELVIFLVTMPSMHCLFFLASLTLLLMR